MNQPSVEELQNELQKKDLKIRALLEDITETRDKNAELRVDVTVLSQMLQQAQGQLASHEENENTPHEVVHPAD